MCSSVFAGVGVGNVVAEGTSAVLVDGEGEAKGRL